MLKRWQMPLALIVVLVCTHLAYNAMRSQSATIQETIDADGNVVGRSEFVKGRVLDLVRATPEPGSTVATHILEIELLGGTWKGKRALFRNSVNPNGIPTLNIDAVVGDIVLCRVGGSGDILNAGNLIQDYNRDGFIIGLLGVLIAVVIIVGRNTGIRAAITMVLNGVILYYIMLPMIHKGYNPVWTVVLTCSLISVQSRLIVAGFGRKTYAAILGTIGGATGRPRSAPGSSAASPSRAS